MACRGEYAVAGEPEHNSKSDYLERFHELPPLKEASQLDYGNRESIGHGHDGAWRAMAAKHQILVTRKSDTYFADYPT